MLTTNTNNNALKALTVDAEQPRFKKLISRLDLDATFSRRLAVSAYVFHVRVRARMDVCAVMALQLSRPGGV